MDTSKTDGKTLWQSWRLLLDQVLVFTNSQRWAKMSPKQQETYRKTMHEKLKAISQAAYEKDMEYITSIQKSCNTKKNIQS